MMSKVGSSRKLPVGEYSIRMTSGASTSKRASPSVTVAWAAAVPLAMLMLLDRLTGEVSEVAVCALAPVPAARTTIRAAAAAMAALARARRRQLAPAMAPRPSGGCVQGELLTPLSATNTKKCYDFLLRKATKCVKVLVVNIELIWSKSCGSQSAMRGCSVMHRITYLDREMP